MVLFILVIIVALVCTVIMKKINPERTWIYAIYALFIVTMYLLFVLIDL